MRLAADQSHPLGYHERFCSRAWGSERWARPLGPTPGPSPGAGIPACGLRAGPSPAGLTSFRRGRPCGCRASSVVRTCRGAADCARGGSGSSGRRGSGRAVRACRARPGRFSPGVPGGSRKVPATEPTSRGRRRQECVCPSKAVGEWSSTVLSGAKGSPRGSSREEGRRGGCSTATGSFFRTFVP